MAHSIEGKHILVVGLGKSGRSAIEFCRSRGASRISVSDAGVRPDDAMWLAEQNIACEFGGHSRELCHAADLILLSPGVPHDLPVFAEARDKGIPVIGELALAPRYLKTPVIAVTGTNGKTTVTTLIGELMRVSGFTVFVGGNIGTPLTDYLMTDQEADWLVLEVSSFQLDTADTFRPNIGLLLNISPDHLDRYPSYDDYALSKLNLFARQGQDDVTILNVDDPDTVRLMDGVKSVRSGWEPRRRLVFGRRLEGRIGAEVQGTSVRLVGDWLSGAEDVYELETTQLGMPPNVENAAAAILAARVAGCQPAGIKQGIGSFHLLPHRMTVVDEVEGVRYINDSKATNIGAVQAALEAMTAQVVLIAGGRDKGGDYSLMAHQIRDKVKALLLIGEARDKMAAAFNTLTHVEKMDSLQQAVHRAHDLAFPGDVVLLSPACASFDMFTGYVERGQVFTRLVRELQG
ncbi:MAG: UDP-N-acetylmuramoyl-L-alanine--D-glutamate ligase [Desulfobulbaceae bacterium]|nr:UDP-N-acetylmuramoyl-L-alanine--D-glutamate ligase [Desulfobulbaceae bacterium]